MKQSFPIPRSMRASFAIARLTEHLSGYAPTTTDLQKRLCARLQRTGERKKLPIAELQSLDPQQLRSEFIRKGLPVVIRCGAKDWPCVRRWSPQFFINRYGEQNIEVMDNDNRSGLFNIEAMSIRNYMEQVAGGNVHKHLRFGNLLHRFSELHEDFDEPTIREAMGTLRVGHNVGVFIGAKGTQTRLHAAPPDNFFVQAYGRKRWHLIPAHFEPAVQPVMGRSTYFTSAFDPDVPNFDTHPAMRYVDYYEFELEPGDILYNPPSYWHQVTNLSASIGVGFRWMSPMSPKLSPSQFALFFLATNPSLLFAIRNKRDYTRVLREADRKARTQRSDAA